MQTSFNRVVDALKAHGSKVTGEGYTRMAQCPAHDDQVPSLSITYESKDEKTLYYCHRGCSQDEVIHALRLEKADLFDNRRGEQYPYYTADGELARLVTRAPDKKFSQAVKIKDYMPIYRLPEVCKAVKDGRPVWFVEGEKDVHVLVNRGVEATTAPQGAASIKKADLSPLKGATVKVVIDQDDAGRKWAETLKQRLTGIAKKVEFFNPAEGKDTADHFVAGKTFEDFVPAIVRDTTNRVTPKLTEASTFKTKRKQFLWNGFIPLGTSTLMSGRGGVGKSTMSLHIAAQVTRGTCDGDLRGQPRDVLIVSPEDEPEAVTIPRLRAAGADLKRVKFLSVETHIDGETTEGQIILPYHIPVIKEAVEISGAALIILDPVIAVIDGNNNKAQEVRQAVSPLDRLAQELNITIILIAHFNKGSGDVAEKVTGSHAWRDVARSLLVFGHDKDNDQVIMSQDKANYTKNAGNLAFKIEEAAVPTDEGENTHVGVVKIMGATDTTVNDIINRSVSSEDFEDDEAGRWLLSYLEGKEDLEATRPEIFKAARANGFSESTVKRAQKRCAVRTELTKTYPSKSIWIHPNKPGDPAEPAVLTRGNADPAGDLPDPAGDPPEPAVLTRENTRQKALFSPAGSGGSAGSETDPPADSPPLIFTKEVVESVYGKRDTA